MSKIATLEQKVKNLYAEKNSNRAEWTDWLADNHVFVVADYATELAAKHGADKELSRAAALLHDIADAKMSRDNPSHEEESSRMASELMHEAGYSEDDINLVVNDAIRYHSCYGDEQPSSVEGQILATADALAHIKTDFYLFATWAMAREKTLDEIKSWALKKLDRDFNSKILFDNVREEVLPRYTFLKELFRR